MEREDPELLHPRRREQLLRAARERPGRVLRLLTARLYSAEPAAKWRAVRALGRVAADEEASARIRWPEQLRRWFWALNDESGAVPYGMPEAIGEVLARRPELQAGFLPLLCGLLTEQERLQTGPVEQGVLWALGRLGPQVAPAYAEIPPVLAAVAREHPDPLTRRLALWACDRMDFRSRF